MGGGGLFLLCLALDQRGKRINTGLLGIGRDNSKRGPLKGAADRGIGVLMLVLRSENPRGWGEILGGRGGVKLGIATGMSFVLRSKMEIEYRAKLTGFG